MDLRDLIHDAANSVMALQGAVAMKEDQKLTAAHKADLDTAARESAKRLLDEARKIAVILNIT